MMLKMSNSYRYVFKYIVQAEPTCLLEGYKLYAIIRYIYFPRILKTNLYVQDIINHFVYVHVQEIKKEHLFPVKASNLFRQR